MSNEGPKAYPVVYDALNGLQYSFQSGYVAIPEAPLNAITSLTGDVTATGPGAAAATVALVGGSSASSIHAATLLANAATNLDTVSTIVKRDSSGNFSAGTITANLTGTASAIADGSVTPSKIAGSGNFVFPGNIELQGGLLTLGGTLEGFDNVGGHVIDLFSNGNIVGQIGPHGYNAVSPSQIAAGTLSPDASAVMDLESTTQGFLPPQMTTTQRNAIASPKEGLIVYDLTLHQLWEYQNGSWAEVGGGSAGVSSVHSDSNSNITGAVQLVSGTNVTLSQTGQAITINASGGGGGGLVSSHHNFTDFNANLTATPTAVLSVTFTPASSSNTVFIQATYYLQLPTTGDQVNGNVLSTIGGDLLPNQGPYNANASRIDMVVPIQAHEAPGVTTSVTYSIMLSAASGTDCYVGRVELFVTEYSV